MKLKGLRATVSPSQLIDLRALPHVYYHIQVTGEMKIMCLCSCV